MAKQLFKLSKCIGQNMVGIRLSLQIPHRHGFV
jgi:hypothetical protein